MSRFAIQSHGIPPIFKTFGDLQGHSNRTYPSAPDPLGTAPARPDSDPILTAKVLTSILAKGFCCAKFWVKFAFWRGAVRGEVLGEVGAKFSGLFCLGRSKQKMQQKFQPKSPTGLHSKAGEIQGKTSWRSSAKGTPRQRAIQEATKDPEVEGSRSSRSSVIPFFRGTKVPKTFV